MEFESIREFCLSLPYVTEDMALGEDFLLWRVADKIFACCHMERPDNLTLKCDAEYALELRERHPGITGAWHWNKRYWNDVDLRSHLSDEFVRELIRHSYREVVKKLPKRLVAAHPGMSAV